MPEVLKTLLWLLLGMAIGGGLGWYFTRKAIQKQLKENPPVKLSIAYGMGELRCGKDNPEDIEKKADERMYENKLMLKKQVSC